MAFVNRLMEEMIGPKLCFEHPECNKHVYLSICIGVNPVHLGQYILLVHGEGQLCYHSASNLNVLLAVKDSACLWCSPQVGRDG